MRFSERYGTTFLILGKYVSRALTLFFGEGKNFVTIKAAERLMDRALWVAEVVRRKVEGLHQIVTVSERQVVDVYEPTEEGLVTVRDERFLTILEVTLTREPTAEQKKQPGYHAPLNIKSDFLTKETWEQGEKQRDERRNGDHDDDRRGERRERGERRGDHGHREVREDRPRREYHEDRPRRDNQEGRDGERRRGRNNRNE